MNNENSICLSKIVECDGRKYVTFGNYFQRKENPSIKEPIEWLVLAQQENRLLLLSRYALDVQPYHLEWEDIAWENCSLRTWLNGPFFYEAFSERERSFISLTHVDNGICQGSKRNLAKYEKRKEDWVAALNSADTADRIFLLSFAEAEKYFPSEEERVCHPTAYADDLAAYSFCGSCEWWLRSPGEHLDLAESVSSHGFLCVSDSKFTVDCPKPVRPALWIQLNAGTSSQSPKGNSYSTQRDAIQTADRLFEERQFVEAIRRYKEAATLGSSYAQYRVGSMYESGTGVKQNIWIAILWYRCAALQGNKPAEESVERLKTVKRCFLIDRHYICWLSNKKACVRDTELHEWIESEYFTDLLLWTRGDHIDELLEKADYDEINERILTIRGERGTWFSKEYEQKLKPCRQVIDFMKRTGQTSVDFYRTDHLSRFKKSRRREDEQYKR